MLEVVNFKVQLPWEVQLEVWERHEEREGKQAGRRPAGGGRGWRGVRGEVETESSALRGDSEGSIGARLRSGFAGTEVAGRVYVPHDAFVVAFVYSEAGGVMYSVMLSSCISCKRVRRSETDSTMVKNRSEETDGGKVFNISTSSSSSAESLFSGSAA